MRRPPGRRWRGRPPQAQGLHSGDRRRRALRAQHPPSSPFHGQLRAAATLSRGSGPNWATATCRGCSTNIFLMAARRETDDAFEHDHKLRLLSLLSGGWCRFTFNPGDRALIVSERDQRPQIPRPPRFPTGPRLADLLPRKVVLVNCQDVDYEGDDIQVHQYYRRQPGGDRGCPAGARRHSAAGDDRPPVRAGNSAAYRIEKNPAFDAPI